MMKITKRVHGFSDRLFLMAMLTCTVFFAGCAEQATTTEDSTDHDHVGGPNAIEAPVAPAPEGEQYVLGDAPAEFLNVIEARETTKNEDEVVVFGQIGGSHEPWVEGRAIFTIVDDSLKSCDEIHGDSCPTPWDYCCETPKLKTATALVKIVDEKGNAIETDARKLLGVRELTSVIVKGKAQRDDAGNLTILTTGLFVQK